MVKREDSDAASDGTAVHSEGVAHYTGDTMTADVKTVVNRPGGAPNDTRNLWPEPGKSPNPKDRVEDLLHKQVCDGTISLALAQQEISTDWVSLYHRDFGP